MKTKDLTTTALMAALICIAGPLTLAIGPVPLSLATFAVYLAGAVLGARKGTAAVAVYLLIGIVGVPVFSGFSGGFQKLAGVTGGYLAGYLPCAWLSGIRIRTKEEGRPELLRRMALMAAGTLVLYIIGTVWFMIQTRNGLGAALSLCVLPFLPGDAAKIAAAALLAPKIRKGIGRKSGS